MLPRFQGLSKNLKLTRVVQILSFHAAINIVTLPHGVCIETPSLAVTPLNDKYLRPANFQERYAKILIAISTSVFICDSTIQHCASSNGFLQRSLSKSLHKFLMHD